MFSPDFNKQKIKIKNQEEKRITREEFKAAVSAASDYIVNDLEVEGMEKSMAPLTGIMFAAKMEEILFGEEED